MRRGVTNPAAVVGQRRLSDRLYWECRKQYGAQSQKPAWQFWKDIFRKIEQVKSFFAC